MSLGSPVKVIGRPPNVRLSAALEARVAALLQTTEGPARTTGPDRLDPAILLRHSES